MATTHSTLSRVQELKILIPYMHDSFVRAARRTDQDNPKHPAFEDVDFYLIAYKELIMEYHRITGKVYKG